MAVLTTGWVVGTVVAVGALLLTHDPAGGDGPSILALVLTALFGCAAGGLLAYGVTGPLHGAIRTIRSAPRKPIEDIGSLIWAGERTNSRVLWRCPWLYHLLSLTFLTAIGTYLGWVIFNHSLVGALTTGAAMWAWLTAMRFLSERSADSRRLDIADRMAVLDALRSGTPPADSVLARQARLLAARRLDGLRRGRGATRATLAIFSVVGFGYLVAGNTLYGLVFTSGVLLGAADHWRNEQQLIPRLIRLMAATGP